MRIKSVHQRQQGKKGPQTIDVPFPRPNDDPLASLQSPELRKAPASTSTAAVAPTSALTPAPAAASPTPVSQAELNTWLQQAKDLPDVRWEKVRAMRKAIEEHTIDADMDERLSQLADRLPAELIDYWRSTGETESEH
ncbi:MAG: flagellar biosynthesis anti-sigma factor FlgM [Phycisphaerae bacterium]|nr:flagellar biosynthesis anti-sigma factor FlgM [Phycisphaerae bacterium]